MGALRPTKPTTKAHPLDLRLSVPVAHSLVLTGVPVLEQAVVTSDQSACDVCVCGVRWCQRPVSVSGNNGWLGLFKVRAAFTPIGDAGTVNCQWCVSEGRSSTSKQRPFAFARNFNLKHGVDVDFQWTGPLTQLAQGPLC